MADSALWDSREGQRKKDGTQRHRIQGCEASLLPGLESGRRAWLPSF